MHINLMALRHMYLADQRQIIIRGTLLAYICRNYDLQLVITQQLAMDYKVYGEDGDQNASKMRMH